MKPLSFSLLFLMSLFLIVLFNAGAMAFSITSNLTTNTVCPSSTIVIEDIVSSATPGAFTVTVEGTAATFTTVVPTGFWLEGGQVQSIYLYITPSSKVVPGNYKLKVTVEKNGEIKKVEHTIIVENCHNTVIIAEPEKQTVCACEEKKILLRLSNKGNYIENYRLRVEGPAAQWINLSSESLTLASCKNTTLEAYIMTPCNIAGTYEVNFVVESDSPYAKANEIAEIEVVSCYDYALGGEKIYYNMCEAEVLEIPLKIKNLGTGNNIYRINMYGPSWTMLDQKTINVAKGEEKTFHVIAKPPYRTEGNFSVNIEVLSEYGKVLKKYDVRVDVEKCYDVSVTIEEDKDRMCNALSNTYAVVVKNKGKYNSTLDVTLTGQEWATISEKHFTLKANEEKALVLDIHPPYNTLGRTYDFVVKARDPVSGAEAEDTISIETVTVKDCYMPAISTKEDVVRVARDSTATAIFIVENKGEQLAHYNIELSGTATSFSQINPGAIDIEPGEAQTIYLYIAPPPETKLQDYTVTVTARLEDTTILASKGITITVLETEDLEEPIVPQPEEEKEKPTFFQNIWKWITNLFKPKPAEETKEQPKEQEEEETKEEPEEQEEQAEEEENKTEKPGNKAPVLLEQIPQITIEQGKTYTLDLDDYFGDPDEDQLTFVAVKPPKVEITIAGSIVRIQPKEEFEGTQEITFYASDGKEVTQSNAVVIKVIAAKEEEDGKEEEVEEPEEKKEKSEEYCDNCDTNQNFFSKYKGLIIAGAIILLVIIVVLSGLGKKIISFFEEEVPANNNHKGKKK
ncbi:MAG: hypothetical protein K6T16_01385 [Candidatus Pacearchaeota archaeon]|nr:hypothetical protein [Candidatus Pacearchaeota archaeon]